MNKKHACVKAVQGRCKRGLIRLLAVLIGAMISATAAEPAPQEYTSAEMLAPVKDIRGLPRVLLIGDSISIMYTVPVRKLLSGVANVHRIPDNAQYTAYGIEHLEQWLGEEDWDVIHFNWGIWDTHTNDAGEVRSTITQYSANLRRLVERLRKTGARLIWASTTPIAHDTPGELGLRRQNTAAYNAAAREIMCEEGIDTDDLYGAILPQLGQVLSEDGVHFTPEGSILLARQVAQSIRRGIHAPLSDSGSPGTSTPAECGSGGCITGSLRCEIMITP